MSSYCAGKLGKHTLLLVVSSVFMASLAWAEAPPPSGDLFAGSGGCMLPDLTGLSPEQIAAAALGAGLEVTPAGGQDPPCPQTFDCSSINCAALTPCMISSIGPCCKPAHGPSFCCGSGNIQVTRCECDCIDIPGCDPRRCSLRFDVKLSC